MTPLPSSGARVLLLVAHPDLRRSRVNRRLLDAARRLAGARLELRDLYALYPDFAIDVEAEQAALKRADLIVWQHPLQWYSMPALMKLWLDEVLRYGWAYGRHGRALTGKDLWLLLSTGGSEAAFHPSGYNRRFIDAFLPPYEQTAAMCGLRFLPPLVLHDALRIDDATLDAHVHTVTERLTSYPDWPELADLARCDACEPPDADRPDDCADAAAAPPEVHR
ncbi:MAG TPA: NAD(P)H-dependent oxidoreductase [Burkholderiaceae bacterium]|nr:NAD(P)H-dependent oxidoreductase [Burkholderiaceae bacterium]HMZ02459.1 NAD(P)H-dependent oxidoreductase [Burkholderiaceae bacterium]HNB45821.1 NAD(P)H-dependent oxidoreductase [Burkholderiaceae bacterium]